jgi:predicted component of type VI protein secretion system
MKHNGEGMTGKAAARIQGDDLIGEVLRNMEEGLFRIRGKTLVPAIYRIYLNSVDFEPFRDVVPFIAGEIRAALDERLAQWNGTQRKFALRLPRRKQEEPEDETGYVRIPDDWIIDIFPDLDDKLALGEIEVYSELGAPQKAEYGAGSLTRRIVPEKPALTPPKGPEIADSAPTVATPHPSATSAFKEAPEENDRTKGRAFAYLRYTDEGGEHMFEMTRSQIVIGRGGRSFWVDVKLDTLPDVSREHCRIRRDGASGGFVIEDISKFGTAVDGRAVGQNASAPLPAHAVITLAGVIDLNWQTN